MIAEDWRREVASLRERYDALRAASGPAVAWPLAGELIELQAKITVAERGLAEADGGEYLDPINARIAFDDGTFEVTPSPSGGNERLVAESMVPEAPVRIVFWASRRESDIWADAGALEAKFTQATPMPYWGVFQLRFGYPNEEALGTGPARIGYEGVGLYVCKNSSWESDIVEFNRQCYPGTPTTLGLHHYVLHFKESTLEVLAANMEINPLR